jgi:hypothetical protein
MASHSEVLARARRDPANPLHRFGQTDPQAGEIERLCDCGKPDGKHADSCRSFVCSDWYPHTGDPCVICESTPAEFALYLDLLGGQREAR